MVTVITRTIGPSGRDYASFTLAEADVANIGTSANLVANDEAIVFEADAGTYSESLIFTSTLTTDATRQVTYKPAAGSEHGGVFGGGVYVVSSFTITIQGTDDFTKFVGLAIESTASDAVQYYGVATFDSCMIDRKSTAVGSDRAVVLWDPGSAGTSYVTNCVLRSYDAEGVYVYLAADAKIINCTAIRTGVDTRPAFKAHEGTPGTQQVEFINCVALNQPAYEAIGTPTVTGSNNFGGSTKPWPVALQGSPYPITPTTNTSPGAGDWAIYEAATGRLYNIAENDVWQQGVGPTANADVPATDILGYARYGATANPGAFELGLGLPGPYAKPRHFQVNTAADPHAVSLWAPNLKVL